MCDCVAGWCDDKFGGREDCNEKRGDALQMNDLSLVNSQPSNLPYTAAQSKATTTKTSGPKPPYLPTDAEARKKIPLWSGLVNYFPDALVAIAQLSQKGNDQHNPGQPLHWSREKSSDHHDTLLRHAFESGTIDVDGQRHSTKAAWRALAILQLEIERDRE